MILIAAVDETWGLGHQGQLLVRIPPDLKRFQELTTGNVILVGRKTLQSFPKGKPLPHRVNLVLTSNPSFQCDDAVVCHTIDELLKTAHLYTDKEIYVAGGGSLYEQLLPHCSKAYITKVKGSFPADTYLENLDISEQWTCIEQGAWQESHGMTFAFCTYTKK